MCLYYQFWFLRRVRFVSGDLISSYWCKNKSALLLEHVAREGNEGACVDWQADLLGRKGLHCMVSLLPIKKSREGSGTPLQYFCLENHMDGGAWWAAVHGITKSRTRLSDFTLTFHFHALEKEMATHASVFAWRIPGTGEPGGLPSMGLHRVGHD